MTVARRAAGPALALAVALGAAGLLEGSPPRAAEAQSPILTPPAFIKEAIFDAGRGLSPEWADYGWTPHTLARGAPARLDLSGYGGLILARPGLAGSFGGLTFRYRAPESFGDFLEVRLESAGGEPLARVRVGRDRGRRLADGFTEVFLPMEELDPGGAPFERVVFHGWRPVSAEAVLLDRVGLTGAPVRPAVAPRGGWFSLDCRAPGRPIHPHIYGIAGGADEQPHAFQVGATIRRWGGNPTSRYNWELGNAWNTNHNWFFRNMAASARSGFTFETWLEENRSHGLESTVVVPMLGWVAKDTSSYSFPVSVLGPQQATAWDLPDAGNGIRPDGKPFPPQPPTRTSVPSTPEFVERWVRKIRERDGGKRRVVSWILDNEPTLWHETHRDVHPEPLTYDELLQKTLAYAAAVRRADPGALIAGPAEWGWMGYHYSGKDKVSGTWLRTDRRAHGDVPLIPWYLARIRDQERKTGARILDILDVHYYPAIASMGLGEGGETTPEAAALRIRSTRSLWDPTYLDESWIKERIKLIPMLRQWIEENHPGLGISIGEWSFGAEKHMSGGLAVAEALGRFGAEGVTSAYYWVYPADRSPAFWAFRAYRNYDGAGGRFLDRSVPVAGEGTLASAFASTDEARRRIVAVVLNEDPSTPLAARLAVDTCGAVASARGFTYAGGEAGFRPLEVSVRPGLVEATAAPYSISVVQLDLSAPGGK